jgi:hypothetical protein
MKTRGSKPSPPDIVNKTPPRGKNSTLLAGNIEPFSEFMSAAQERTWLLYVVGKSRFLTQEKRTAEQQNLAYS